jgi:hypothetical protein
MLGGFFYARSGQSAVPALANVRTQGARQGGGCAHTMCVPASIRPKNYLGATTYGHFVQEHTSCVVSRPDVIKNSEKPIYIYMLAGSKT